MNVFLKLTLGCAAVLVLLIGSAQANDPAEREEVPPQLEYTLTDSPPDGLVELMLQRWGEVWLVDESGNRTERLAGWDTANCYYWMEMNGLPEYGRIIFDLNEEVCLGDDMAYFQFRKLDGNHDLVEVGRIGFLRDNPPCTYFACGSDWIELDATLELFVDGAWTTTTIRFVAEVVDAPIE